MKLATAAAMKEIDRRAIEEMGIPSLALMERAGAELARRCPLSPGQKAVVVIKGGKNGGDGLVAARLLLERGVAVLVMAVGGLAKVHPDTAEMARRLCLAGGTIHELTFPDAAARDSVMAADCIVDALFGIGLSREVQGLDREVIGWINESPACTLSADIASGLSADTGLPMGQAVHADRTVTFTLAKRGMAAGQGRLYSGEIAVCDIGIPEEAVGRPALLEETGDKPLIASFVPKRAPDGHKGTFGKVLFVGGSVGYAGAPRLSSLAAVKSGAGVVFCGVPAPIYPIVAGSMLSPVVFPLPDNGEGTLGPGAAAEVLDRLTGMDACMIGPGLSRFSGLTEFLLTILHQCDAPLVLDADGINGLAGHIDALKKTRRPVVLTPHGGEFARLLGHTPSAPMEEAAAFALETGVTLLLKGHATQVSAPDGRRYFNNTGNDGMAKGGSGDVLTGCLGALLAQGAEAYEAACAAAWLHGFAGDRAAEKRGRYGMTPEDLLDCLPEAFLTLGL